jgi:hypothetical protein
MRKRHSNPKVSLPQLRDAEQRMQIDRTSTEHAAYREFLRFFQECGHIDERVLIIGAHMVYGWMPTMLELYGDNFSKVAALLGRVQTGERLSPTDLEIVKSTVNHSIEGASKLLHFVNPKCYPIWDSRVRAFINSGRDNQSRKAKENDVSDYISYVTNCDELVQQDEFHAIHHSVIAKIGYEVSMYRAVELVMYEEGKRCRKQ